MINLLLEFGASVHATDIDLLNPAMLATEYRPIQVIQALERGGADFGMRNAGSKSVLHLAARRARFDVLLYLRSRMSPYDLGKENIKGISVLALMFTIFSSRMPQLLNLSPNPGSYYDRESNILTAAVQAVYVTPKGMKMLLERVPQELLSTLLTHRAQWEAHRCMQPVL